MYIIYVRVFIEGSNVGWWLDSWLGLTMLLMRKENVPQLGSITNDCLSKNEILNRVSDILSCKRTMDASTAMRAIIISSIRCVED